jgi:dihydroorotate dehydrogenase
MMKAPEWFLNPKPLYDIHKTYLDNLENGPFFQGTIPKRNWTSEDQWIDFLGFKLASSLGIPSGPLLDAKWIGLSSSLGFDLVAYKTIRSYEHPSHPLPNVVPVKTKRQLNPDNLPDHVSPALDGYNFLDDTIGITNSFGNPSRSPEFLKNDLAKAQKNLKKGQAMIVSIFGSEHDGVDILEDFARAAHFAKECGAKLIEANFSCPNVAASEGSLFSSPELVYKFSKKIINVIGDIPLIIKVGALNNSQKMREAIVAAAKAGVRAICGLNTISMKVLDNNGKSVLGPKRATSGICGNPIRNAALTFTKQARVIIDEEKLDLKLMSTGGVTRPEHFQLFLDAGADIAMSATGMMWDPYLAMKYHYMKEKNLLNSREKIHV